MSERSLCNAAVQNLRNTFRSGKTRPIAWRLEQLHNVRRLLVENEAAIVEALAKDLGRCRFESCVLEITAALGELDYIVDNLASWMRPVSTPLPALMAPAISEYVYEPFGVCLVIAPFNYPVYLCLSPLFGALCAGNCVVVKPSEMTPACEKLLAQLLPRYLDQEAVTVICGAVEMTTALLEQRWDKIFFTGSTRVGKVVMKAAAQHLTPVSLELGGKSPTIIDDTVTDMTLVAQRVCWGKFANAGQTCIAPDYVLCHEKVYDAFVAALGVAVKRFYGDDPQKSPDLARIVSQGHCERLKGLLTASPGNVIGGRVDVENRYVQPTFVTDVRMDSPIMQDEIFGPLLPIIKVRSIDQALEYLKGPEMERPLALYIFSKNRSTIDRIIEQVPSGGVLVNDTLYHCGNFFVPFGGVGSSGLGGYHGKFSHEAFSHRRTVMRRDDHILLDAPMRYPPYTDSGLSVVRFAATKLPPIGPIKLSCLFSFKSLFKVFVLGAAGVGISTMVSSPGFSAVWQKLLG